MTKPENEEKSYITDLGNKAIYKAIYNELNNQLSILFYNNRDFYETKSEIFKLSELVNERVEELYGVKTPDSYNSSMFFTDKSKVNSVSKFEYFFSLSYHRWDIRMALDESLIPELADPFDPLPVVPPATLVGPDGLPASSGRIVSEQWLRARPNAITLPEEGSVASPTISDEEYPLPIPWDGILVDDPESEADIVYRIGKVLEVLHGEEAEEREQELVEELGVKSLREYLQKPAGFFADHLTRYTKSRRKAPIYWPLSVGKGRYTLWIYYPRLSESTLFTAVNTYIDPKLKAVRSELEEIRQDKNLRSRFDELTELAEELETMRRALLEIGELPYKPDHDDGVPICAAPLYPLVRHSGWRKTLKDDWERLEKGDYDWAHIAYAIWPERVREKAKQDKSIAIAHDLEDQNVL